MRVALKTIVRARINFYDDRRVYVRATPVRTAAYPLHVHTVAITDLGNGWTDAHPDGSRHQVVELEFKPATYEDGRRARDAHVHDLAGRARR